MLRAMPRRKVMSELGKMLDYGKRKVVVRVVIVTVTSFRSVPDSKEMLGHWISKKATVGRIKP